MSDPNNSPSGDIGQEIRRRIRSSRHLGAWERGLAASSALALCGMLYCAAIEGRTNLRVQTSASTFLAGLALLLLLALLARARARHAHVSDLQTLSETIERERLGQQAFNDRLTGVYNRAGLEEIFPARLRRAERSGSPLAVAVLDLNDFHTLNNRFGHAAGDSALVEFANCIRNSVRGSDVVGRYGGDEFVVMLEDTSADGAAVVLARLENRLSSAALPEQMRLSFCAGVCFFRSGMDFTALFQQADEDLMRRKNASRVAAGSRN